MSKYAKNSLLWELTLMLFSIPTFPILKSITSKIMVSHTIFFFCLNFQIKFLSFFQEIYQEQKTLLQDIWNNLSKFPKREFPKEVLKLPKHHQSIIFAMSKNESSTISELLFKNASDQRLIQCFFNVNALQKTDKKSQKSKSSNG